MTRNDSPFDFSHQSEIEEFDPFVVEDDDDDVDYDEEPGALGIRDLESEAPEEFVRVDNRTPSEKTADLFKQMAPQRRVLLGILAFCKQSQPVGSVNAHVDQLQENNHSVFVSADLCRHLELAGALELVTAEGDPYEDVEMEPELVVVDGVEYYETREAPVAYWRTTTIGQEALDADRPFDRLGVLLEENPAYLPVYKKVLLMCSGEGGAATADISAALDGDPLLQEPRRFSPYFTERLEKCDAIAWRNKAWCITEVGHRALDLLADVKEAGVLE